MATGDRPMNGFNPVQDAAYIYAEDVNGNQVKIKTGDLANILGNLISSIKKKKRVEISVSKYNAISFRFGFLSAEQYKSLIGGFHVSYVQAIGPSTYWNSQMGLFVIYPNGWRNLKVLEYRGNADTPAISYSFENDSAVTIKLKFSQDTYVEFDDVVLHQLSLE